jgi:hypothetical protein
MDKNDMIKMNLTPEEAATINLIRTMVSKNEVDRKLMESLVDLTSQLQDNEKYMQKYMDMDDNEFIDEYAEMVGDDVILSVLQDTLHPSQKMGAVIGHIDDDVIDELFEAYVSVDSKREIFLNTQDREELCSQMVDLIMDGNWTPEN